MQRDARALNEAVLPGEVKVRERETSLHPERSIWVVEDSEVVDFLASLWTSGPQRSWAG